MKGFFVFLLFLLFFFSFQIGVTSFFVNRILDPQALKSTLSSNRVYDSTALAIQKIEVPSETPGEAQSILVILKKELTAPYLQTKAEDVLDDTSSWLSGKSNVRPQIDLKDLKEKIYQNLAGQPVPPEVGKTLEKPLVLGENTVFEEVRQFYPYFQNSYIVAFLLSIASLVGVFFLATSKKSGFHGISLALFVASICGLLSSTLILLGLSFAANLVIGTLESSDYRFFVVPIRGVFNPILGSLTLGLISAFLAGLIVSILVFAASFFVKENKAPAK